MIPAAVKKWSITDSFIEIAIMIAKTLCLDNNYYLSYPQWKIALNPGYWSANITNSNWLIQIT